VRGQEFWGIASPSDAYHLPQSLPEELLLFERSGDDFGEVFLQVRVFLRSIHGPSTRVWRTAHGWQTVREGSQTVLRTILTKPLFFGWEWFLYGRPYAPVFRTVRPFLGGQSAAARRTVRSVRSFLPSLFGSFASSLVLPRAL
jgi:hypothetical protein